MEPGACAGITAEKFGSEPNIVTSFQVAPPLPDQNTFAEATPELGGLPGFSSVMFASTV